MNEGLPGLEVGVHYDTINLRTDIPENFLSEEDGSKQWRVGILHNVEVGSFSEPSLLIGVVMAFTNSPRYGDTDRKWKGTMFLLIELKHLTVINGKTDCQAAVVQFLRACTAVKGYQSSVDIDVEPRLNKLMQGGLLVEIFLLCRSLGRRLFEVICQESGKEIILYLKSSSGFCSVLYSYLCSE
uniref:Uncharacterized protein n=1 Tax=Physcomitrium patens TaxID=3218 RepID=A0A7I4AI92_PHYPA